MPATKKAQEILLPAEDEILKTEDVSGGIQNEGEARTLEETLQQSLLAESTSDNAAEPASALEDSSEISEEMAPEEAKPIAKKPPAKKASRKAPAKKSTSSRKKPKEPQEGETEVSLAEDLTEANSPPESSANPTDLAGDEATPSGTEKMEESEAPATVDSENPPAEPASPRKKPSSRKKPTRKTRTSSEKPAISRSRSVSTRRNAFASPDPEPAYKPVSHPSDVTTIDNRGEVELPAQREDLIWHDIQNARRTRRILTGTLGGVEQLDNRSVLAIVYHNDVRVVIPATEMNLNLPSGEQYNYGDYHSRCHKLINNMLGAEIDFVVRGIDNPTRSVVASRTEAMEKKRKLFYLQKDTAGHSRIEVGKVVEARVMAVTEKVVRVEVFGVETSIVTRNLSWEWIGDAREHYTVGDQILVRIHQIDFDEKGGVKISADGKSIVEDNTEEKLQRCKIQGKYAGEVTDFYKGVVYVRLATGVNAVAHSCNDRRRPAKKDIVSFVVTHIDYERNVAVGMITRIIKQNL